MKNYKHLVIFVLLTVSLTVANAQNVVPNASFESKLACPTFYSQIHYCSGWASATDASPDYFNNCDTALFSVPDNGFGWQNAYGGGNAYAGIIAYEKTSSRDYHEYIMTTFPPLNPGMHYYVSINISNAKSRYAVDGFGVLFNTHGGYFGGSSSFWATIPRSPQVDFSSSGVITDTTAWTTLSGIFVADSAYTHAIIGVFKDSAHVLMMPISDLGVTYYYIDEITVRPLEGLGKYPLPESVVTIYPNPLKNGRATFSFTNPNRLPYQLILSNVFGQKVGEWNDVVTDNINIEKENYSAGVYFYQLMNENNIISAGKLFIE